MNFIKKYFEFDELGTNFRKEIMGGLTTFLAMCYILVVNPLTLKEAGMDFNAVFVATALAAIVGSLFMGIIAKYPLALAPGMGLNAFFAFTVVLGMKIPWETALTAVLISSVFFALLTLTGLREKIINAIPTDLKHAVGAGIGLFITFIGFKNSGIIVANPATFVGLGDLHSAPVLLTILGLVVTIVMMLRKVNGAVFYGMVITTVVGIIFNQIELPKQIVSSIPSLKPTFGVALDPIFNDFAGQILTKDFAIVVFTFLFVDFFDCAGTLVAVANQAGFVKDGKLPRAGRALFADSLAGITGAIFGTSTTTAYIESSAGVATGARSGFASVVTALFFFLALFFSPVLSIVTAAVTAPALIIVGVLMAQSLTDISWNKLEIAIPAFLTIISMPLTFGIANGIAMGFIFYPITMVASGQAKKVHPIMYVLAVIFLLNFAFGGE
ncbi:MAG: guanine permease [Bacillales bacterium]|jgi:AGZA family xanthine/uracil permease-like MFS transporter|nr:guanine permease [Bacillales bacterium]